MPARVVVIHDDADFSNQLVIALRSATHEVASFADPMVALAALEKAERVEVLITRVQFGTGKLNGIALALMARTKRPAIKVVFTARSEFEQYTSGIGEFMSIPVNVPELVETVQRLLASSGLWPATL